MLGLESGDLSSDNLYVSELAHIMAEKNSWYEEITSMSPYVLLVPYAPCGYVTEVFNPGPCDARTTVIIPAAERHRRLTSTKLYCLATGH